ncbi:O-antigen ligase family protein [Candidatus Daviesbacteria bacterium]|nr:O-antigen ligase family protein [Candidatus Daviesbacteria bacterium]
MLDKVISYSFYLLFFLTPLFWSSQNYELFEYNKMILVYGFTIIIVGAWLLKIINQKSLSLNRTPLDIPLLLFLGANILSTIFSMDRHTSIWGYYSRSNGGLLSLISYLLLYWAFVSNMDFKKVKTTLKYGLASGFVISIWAILEHFGVSPSCILLRGEFNASCWIQDVQARVFATLGQPNWLAAYLAMLIFPAFYFLLNSTSKNERITYYISLITMYLAFTFTYSRGPTLGLIGGMVIFIIGYIFCHPEGKARRILRFFVSLRMTGLAGILISFLVINILFGSALTSFRLVSKFAAPARPAIALPTASVGTQLENGGTESGQIRFIVWKGALEIFKNNPLFGSGLETFAYSYYQYRPVEHNLTSEWDFLYNKAHNEYLNYLATTGLVGFGTYMIVIGTFALWCIKSILRYYDIKGTKISQYPYILVSILLASYISYLIYNFFLFSVVIIAVFFYLFPALAFAATDSLSPLRLTLFPFIYRRKIYTNIAKGFVVLVTLYLLYCVTQIWFADTLFAKGQKALEAGNPGRAYNLLVTASDINKGELFYKSELSLAAAQAAGALAESDATLSAALKDEAASQINQVLTQSPKNVSYLRTAVRTYFELAALDPKYLEKTVQTLDTAIKLALTDPKLYYNKALVLEVMGKKNEAIKVLSETIKLKPNYLEAVVQLQQATASAKP